MFSVLPFGNRTVILTLTGAQLEQALLNGFSPVCNPAIATGRFPQVSGLQSHLHLQRHDPGRDGHVEDAGWHRRRSDPHRSRPIPCASSPTTSCTPAATATPCSPQGTNVLQPGDDLLQVAIDYVTANSPVGPVVEGRIVGP